MRLNQFVATASGLSRRAADVAITGGRVLVNGRPAQLGEPYESSSAVTLDSQPLTLPDFTYLAFHKPVGYITSRARQGNDPTIYDLLPPNYHHLKPIGRLDRDTSGLLVLTNDGVLANRLAHPSAQKSKLYQIELDRPITAPDLANLHQGVPLDHGPSHLEVIHHNGRRLTAKLRQGRNRQIRRTFEALGYRVTGLHRTEFGRLRLGELSTGQWVEVRPEDLV